MTTRSASKKAHKLVKAGYAARAAAQLRDFRHAFEHPGQDSLDQHHGLAGPGYIANTLKNPMAVLNTVGKIQDSVDKLADFPFIGTPLSSKVGIETDYRFLVCGNYIVFHRTEADSVFIDRVIYGRRDYVKILFDEVLENGGEF